MAQNPVCDLSKHLRFKCPFSCLVAAPSGSGKTMLVRNILADHKTLMGYDRLSVLWCYGQETSDLNRPISGTVTLKTKQGIPSKEEMRGHNVVVIDDLMIEAASDKRIVNIFTKECHHMNINCFFLTQNLFERTPVSRTVSLNANYFIILKNNRDKQQIRVFSRQVASSDPNQFLEAYEDATRNPFGYILLDLKPDTPDHLRLRTRITSQEVKHLRKKFAPIVYVPKCLKT